MSEASLQRGRQIHPELILAILDAPGGTFADLRWVHQSPWRCKRPGVRLFQTLDLSKNPGFARRLSWPLPYSVFEARRNQEHMGCQCSSSCCLWHLHALPVWITYPRVRECSDQPRVCNARTLPAQKAWVAGISHRMDHIRRGRKLSWLYRLVCHKLSRGFGLHWLEAVCTFRIQLFSSCSVLPPLAHLPDCAGMHYRLQLNAYRYIIEKYHGQTVCKMLVVCTHPDLQLESFVFYVPRMDEEIEAAMHSWRMKAEDARGS